MTIDLNAIDEQITDAKAKAEHHKQSAEALYHESVSQGIAAAGYVGEVRRLEKRREFCQLVDAARWALFCDSRDAAAVALLAWYDRAVEGKQEQDITPTKGES